MREQDLIPDRGLAVHRVSRSRSPLLTISRSRSSSACSLFVGVIHELDVVRLGPLRPRQHFWVVRCGAKLSHTIAIRTLAASLSMPRSCTPVGSLDARGTDGCAPRLDRVYVCKGGCAPGHTRCAVVSTLLPTPERSRCVDPIHVRYRGQVPGQVPVSAAASTPRRRARRALVHRGHPFPSVLELRAAAGGSTRSCLTSIRP